MQSDVLEILVASIFMVKGIFFRNVKYLPGYTSKKTVTLF
jgi:hypothetical protein